MVAGSGFWGLLTGTPIRKGSMSQGTPFQHAAQCFSQAALAPLPSSVKPLAQSARRAAAAAALSSFHRSLLPKLWAIWLATPSWQSGASLHPTTVPCASLSPL